MRTCSSKECKHPESELYENFNIGLKVCGACGKVMSESELRVESVFAGNSGAGAQPAVIPRFRPMTRSLADTPGQSTSHISKSCLDSVHRELVNLSHRLRTSHSVVGTAQRLYVMLTERRMHTGVERRITLGVCLYIACRLEKTNHVLSQFVHGVGTTVNMFTALFVRISHALELGIHCASTDSYLETLVEHLDLGPAAPMILARAEEILEKMHAEWIDYGRYPFGVVAAAVLIACQMSGHSQPVDKLSQMVMLTSQTLLRRLREFLHSESVSTANSGKSGPPCVFTQTDANYLVKRITSYNARLREVRQSLVEMFAGSTQLRTPLALSTWKTYWSTRAVACVLCERLTAHDLMREVNDTSMSVSPKEVRETVLKYGMPAYVAFPAPELDEDGVRCLRQEIAAFDQTNMEIVIPHMKVESTSNETAIPAQIRSVPTTHETSSNFYADALEEEANPAENDCWERVQLEEVKSALLDITEDDGLSIRSASTAASHCSRIDLFPEIEYDEAVVQRRTKFIEEIFEGSQKASLASRGEGWGHMNFSDELTRSPVRLPSNTPSNVSLRSNLSSISRASQRRRPRVTKSGETPAQSVLSRLKKGVRAGINKDALVELFEGKSEGIDVPSWNESVVNMQSFRELDEALS